MEAKLLINNKDAYATWGVRMDDGFLTALCAPCTMKEYIENESKRLLNYILCIRFY